MKKLAIFYLVSLFIFSCKKETVDLDNPLVGDWQWESSSGGIAGIVMNPKTQGYDKTLSIASNNTYKIYKNNTLEKSGSFTITKEKSIYSAQIMDFINLGSVEKFVVMNQSANELVLAENVYDGFSHLYKRK